MAVQLAFQVEEEADSCVDAIHAAACAAVDLTARPGFADFTAGPTAITVEHADAARIVLTTDDRWAASAIRTALRRSGAAVEADPGNETTTVTVWAVGEDHDAPQAETLLTEERDEYGRTILLLDGPDGTVEQQCGAGGHNDLIVHAQHPFPSSARIDCPRHGNGCWIRSDWPWSQRTVRSCVKSVVTETGYTWQVAPEAEVRMRDIYLLHVHRTRLTGSAPAFRLAAAPAVQAPSQTSAAPVPSPQPPVSIPRQVDVIRDLADFEGAA
ncbi:hypothetical protein [Streptomyces noursei]|uniref:hypothetical protein n=1 Tax=Streptomyces noursei TaxID=1971 RepID=UPI001672989A|nr:hypothetical protein [Streptomyces noursei]MCZ1013914.1 hypothetical protein [Streptomyces noursei]GGX40907.1 hypothetical protein GCM10010341_73610 [Streptomyces noursei]